MSALVSETICGRGSQVCARMDERQWSTQHEMSNILLFEPSDLIGRRSIVMDLNWFSNLQEQRIRPFQVRSDQGGAQQVIGDEPGAFGTDIMLEVLIFYCVLLRIVFIMD